MRICLVALLSLCALSVIAQSASDRVLEKMGLFHTNFPQEKVYIHHDKPHYVLGEVIWYKVYLVDAILHQTITPSQQVTVELIDPSNEVLSTKTIFITDGGGAGDFSLGPRWTPGRYLLRAYTGYQRNFEESLFFEKEIRVYDAYSDIISPDISTSEMVASGDDVLHDLEGEDDLTVMFFPEGGDLVAGISTIVGVNAVGPDMEGRKIQAEVLNRAGDIVARFATHESGLGFFGLKPEAGERYKARLVSDNTTFGLPDVKSTGYVLRVSEKTDTLTIRASTTFEGGLEDAFVLGHMRGRLFGVISGLSGSQSVLRIPLNETPAGVLHFTLFTSNGRPVSERLVFVEQGTAPVAEMTVAKSLFDRREEVLINIDEIADSVWINGSLTVTDLGMATPHRHASDIHTYLLMESDLKGRIPEPGFFFEGTPASVKLRDVLMLTHGWRRFDWDDLLSGSAVDIDYLPENSLSVRGYITRYGKPNRPIKSNVYLSTLSESFSMEEYVTGEDGVFEFSGIQNQDTVTIFLQATRYKEKKDNDKDDEESGPEGNKWVDIYLQKESIPLLDRDDATIDPEINPDMIKDYFSESRKIQTVDAAYADMITYELDEVVIEVEAYDALEEEHRNNMRYKTPDNRVIPDSMILGSQARNIFELMRGQVAGVEIVGTFPNYAARIRGANSIQGVTTATVVLDGVPVSNELMNTFPVSRVAFIDVIKGLSGAALYGTSGNGVIAVYTKTQEQFQRDQNNPGTLTYIHPGYYQARTFFSPDYGSDSVNEDKPDFRNTLYWDPDVFINPGGSAYLTFYTCDRPSVYSVRFEAITSDGIPIVMEDTFEVR